ncbi:hypothetical protein [Blastococcus deserti]|uniref:Secreted protein n=1 Tax=Blastococcus deserti TaxID=2259033 RepID=A0ABW4X5P6_9ACTN
MRGRRPAGVALGVLATASVLAACSSGDTAGSGRASDTPADSAPATSPAGPPPVGQLVLADEMDDDRNGWGTGLGLSFAAGDYVVAGVTPIGVVTYPDALMDPPESAVVTARFSAPVGTPFVAVTCSISPDGGSFYALGVGRDVMAISRVSGNAETPLDAGVLARADTGVDLTAPHDVQGTCVRGRDGMELWLSVDGAVVLSAVDPEPLDAGRPGLLMVPAPGTPEGSELQARVASWSVARLG